MDANLNHVLEREGAGVEEIDDFELIDKDYASFERIVREHLEWEARQLETETDEYQHALVVARKQDFNKNILGTA